MSTDRSQKPSFPLLATGVYSAPQTTLTADAVTYATAILTSISQADITTLTTSLVAGTVQPILDTLATDWGSALQVTPVSGGACLPFVTTGNIFAIRAFPCFSASTYLSTLAPASLTTDVVCALVGLPAPGNPLTPFVYVTPGSPSYYFGVKYILDDNTIVIVGTEFSALYYIDPFTPCFLPPPPFSSSPASSSVSGDDCLPLNSESTSILSISSPGNSISNKGYCGECDLTGYPCHNFA